MSELFSKISASAPKRLGSTLWWIWLLAVCVSALARAESPAIIVLRIDGAIGPAVSAYVERGLDRARDAHAPLVVIEMDTPGGLDSAMRVIIQKILASPVPVAVYVTPRGARAASAGTYILYAAHIAAMAPGTNLGAATPVSIGAPGSPQEGPGKAMERKQVNDAVVYIRALAALRGRNADWAEQAVREAASLPAADALKLHVIDYVAPDLPALFQRLNGKTVQTVAGPRTLSLQGVQVRHVPPDWRERLLAAITDPNIAYILMLIGIYGLIFELANPGLVLPGVVGAISLLLALFAFQVLPVDYTGLALIVLGLLLFVAEAFLPSFGVLGLGGGVAFVLGSLMLMQEDVPGFGIAWQLIAAAALLTGGFLFTVATLALKAQRRPVLSGREELIGSAAEALEDFVGHGHVRVHGETWRAESNQPIRRGECVRVVGMAGLDGLTLQVEKMPPASAVPGPAGHG